MARIRTIKPEAMQHRKVGRLTDREFRLWVGMLTQADDEGRLVCDADQLRLHVFGYHTGVTSTHVNEALETLARQGLVRIYEVAGERYADFPSWHDHQRINRPTPSKLPPCPNDGVSTHGALSESSMNTHAGSDRIGEDRIGKEGSGREGSVRGGEPMRASAREPSVDGVRPPTPRFSSRVLSKGDRSSDDATRSGMVHRRLANDSSDPPVAVSPTGATASLTPDEERGLPFIAQARRITLDEARRELLTAKLTEAEEKSSGTPVDGQVLPASHVSADDRVYLGRRREFDELLKLEELLKLDGVCVELLEATDGTIPLEYVIAGRDR